MNNATIAEAKLARALAKAIVQMAQRQADQEPKKLAHW